MMLVHGRVGSRPHALHAVTMGQWLAEGREGTGEYSMWSRGHLLGQLLVSAGCRPPNVLLHAGGTGRIRECD